MSSISTSLILGPTPRYDSPFFSHLELLLTLSGQEDDFEKSLQQQIGDLVCYVWDNYLELCETTKDIFLMGVGNAYLGVKMLLIKRGTIFHRASPPTSIVLLTKSLSRLQAPNLWSCQLRFGQSPPSKKC